MPTTTDEPTLPPELKPYEHAGSQASIVRERAAEYKAQPDPTRMSLDEYLAAEEFAEFPSEYVDGVVLAMGGASLDHGIISQRFANAIESRLGDRPCTVVSQGTKLKVKRTGNVFLPDVMVFCGAREVERDRGERLLNPLVIVEVLSPSTADYDHGTKWQNYRRIPSLQEYLLVSQHEPRIERYVRHEEGLWMYSEVSGFEAVVTLESIAVKVALRDVYKGVLATSDAHTTNPEPTPK